MAFFSGGGKKLNTYSPFPRKWESLLPPTSDEIPAYAGMTAWGRGNLAAAVSGDFSSCRNLFRHDPAAVPFFVPK